MAITPDRKPGPLFLEGADADPDEEGVIVYKDGAVRIKDSLGVYNPRSTGGGLTHPQVLARLSLRV